MLAHTPTPWFAKLSAVATDGELDCAIIDGDGKIIAECFGRVATGVFGVRPALVNANRIIRAVSAHDVLIEQLIDMIGLARAGMNAANNDGGMYDVEASLAPAYAALKLAGIEEPKEN